MNAQELKLDYFKIYDVKNQEFNADVTVRGQFDQRTQPMKLRVLDFFANPVSKNRESIFDKNAHLTWYRGVQPVEPKRYVRVENQFGKVEIRTGAGYGLLVPTQKIETGSAFPEQLDHFKVYRLADVEQTPAVELKLRDQFGTDEVRTTMPLFFAVPVAKRYADTAYSIHNQKAHLLIYSITTREIEKRVRVRNQFRRGRGFILQVVRSVMLAVPCVKLEWKL